MASRWRSPPLNSCARLPSAERAIPVSSSAAAARSRRPPSVPARWITSGSSTISAAVNRGFRLAAGCWKISWTSSRRSAEAAALRTGSRRRWASRTASGIAPACSCRNPRLRSPPAYVPRSRLKLTPASATVTGCGARATAAGNKSSRDREPAAGGQLACTSPLASVPSRSTRSSSAVAASVPA